MSCARAILLIRHVLSVLFFFFNDTATTEIYTLSLHDALPISRVLLSALGIAKPLVSLHEHNESQRTPQLLARLAAGETDRKSTRLNSSHGYISYAVFCLKKKMYDETRRSATCRPSCICVHGRM